MLRERSIGTPFRIFHWNEQTGERRHKQDVPQEVEKKQEITKTKLYDCYS